MAKSESSRDTRTKAREMREAQLKSEKRTRVIIIGVVVLVVVAVVAAVAAVMLTYRPKGSALPDEEAAALLGPYADSSPVMYSHNGIADPDPNLPTLTIYFDYSCHVCAQVDTAGGEEIAKAATDGKFNIAYQPVTTVGMDYAKPATTASLIVAQKDPEHWVAFHHALMGFFNEQWTSGDTRVVKSMDQSIDKVAELARSVGVPDEVVSTFDANAVQTYLANSTKVWGEKKFAGRGDSYGTPEYVKDDTKVIPFTLENFASDIISGMAD